MTVSSDDAIRKVTTQLSDELLLERLNQESVTYRLLPHEDGRQPVWRIQLELAYDTSVRLGLDINGDVTLGRGGDEPGFVGLFSAYDTEAFGLSRRHAVLRPTDTRLYIMDLGSTNGTTINGRSIGVNMPYVLTNGDQLRLGRLEVTIRILRRPMGATAALHARTDLSEQIAQAARNITSQLKLNEVLKQAMDMAMTCASADMVAIWLVDEHTSELFLEASHTIDSEEESIGRLRVSDGLARQVVSTGKLVRVHRGPNGQPIRLETGEAVEAALCVPMRLGGVAVGALLAAHFEHNKPFSDHDEKVLVALGDLTAVAVQNARVHETTDRMLARRGKLVNTLRFLLAQNVGSQLNTIIGYSGLLSTYNPDDAELQEVVQQIVGAGNLTAHVISRLVEMTSLSEEWVMQPEPCDLVEVTQQVKDELGPAARDKDILLLCQVYGEPYVIAGDAPYLKRAAYNIVENALRFTHEGGQVAISLIFSPDGAAVRVRDSGPGIREDLLPHLFDEYVHSSDADSEHIGLGLEMVSTIIEAHRGKVSARNLEDQGAEVMFTLPPSLRAL